MSAAAAPTAAEHRPWCDQAEHALCEQDGTGMPAHCISAPFEAGGMGGWLRETDEGQTCIVLDWHLKYAEFSVEDAAPLIAFLAAGLAKATGM